ncbi:unnamed protein product [Clonostachys rosea]|uniref:PLP-dependent transferase n=1 Tax=Bionectria ochroleuca TaxID=29856 RepID=A0ABY6U3F5_BIOOC|nr:unnamed protein product [Clonostachys rosea]
MTDPFVAQSHILHRAFGQRPEKVVSAKGIQLMLESGKTMYDATCGPSVSVLGHHQPKVTDAITRQLNQVAYIYSGARFTADPNEELASMILESRPGGLSKAIFVNSGSEATDAAIKLATQYWHERGLPNKSHVISRKQSYHGNTIGALNVSGHTSRREIYRDWISHNVSFVDSCYAFRLQKAGESTNQYVQRLRDQLEAEIIRVGPDNISAFIAETVSGTTLGCLPPVPGYFKAVRDLCDKYDILLILDEIMCGMGKTGTMHAWEQEGIRGPDIQTIGKALGGGFVPLSGVLLHQKIFDALAAGSKGLLHGHTFQAHPIATAAAVAVQKIIKEQDLLNNVTRMGRILEDTLEEMIRPLPFVADIRGRGLFWAVEFLVDPEKGVAFPEDSRFCNKVVDAAFENGLNILGNLGVTGDIHVEHIIIAPPYVVSESDITDIVQLLKVSIEEVSRPLLEARQRTLSQPVEPRL